MMYIIYIYQCFSNLNVHTYNMGILLQMQILGFQWTWVESPRFCIFNKLPDDAEFADLWTTP